MNQTSLPFGPGPDMGHHWSWLHVGPVIGEVAFPGYFCNFGVKFKNFAFFCRCEVRQDEGERCICLPWNGRPDLGSKIHKIYLKSASYVHETHDLLEGWRAPPSTIREISLRRLNTHQYHHNINLTIVTTVAAKNMKHYYFNFTNLLILQVNVTNTSQSINITAKISMEQHNQRPTNTGNLLC